MLTRWLYALQSLITFTGEECQIARYNAVAWGPSNLTAQQDSSVQSDEALSALAEQLAYTIPSGTVP